MADTRSTIELLFSGNARDAEEAIRRLRESLRGLSRDENDQLRDSQGRFAARSRQMKILGTDVDKVSDGLQRFFVSSTKAVGALGAIGNVLPVVAGLAGSVTTAAGALLVLPAAGIGAAAAITTLKIATAGFGDAVKAADPAAFAEATKDMAPAAVATAVALRDLNPQVKALRQEVQQAFFRDFAGDAKLLGNTYLPVLRPQLAGIATEFNGMGREAAKALIAPSAVADLNGVLGATRTQLGDMTPALANVLTGVLAIAGEGSEAFGTFGIQITSATARFKQWATQAAETGRITELIRAGKEELGQFGEVAQNVGGILEAVFRGLSLGGVDFAASLADSTQALEDFLDSAEGQETLKALGETLKVTGEVVREVLLVALQELGPVIQEAAPAVQEFARALGDVLVDAIRTVGPLLQDFAGFISDNASGINNFLPVLAGLFLGFKALSIITSVVGWVRTASASLLGLTLGPIGGLLVALGLVAAAIAIFVGGEDDAADAAQRHQDAVDKLAGSLDQYSGAVTEATRSQIAHELSAAKLSDGTTKLTDALKGAGISFNDYAAAASGNEDALQRVNGQLLDQAKQVIVTTDAWKAQGAGLEKSGISLDLLSAAALGNVQAQDELAQALLPTSKNLTAAQNQARDLTERFRDQIGPLGELGSTLGGYSGALKDAQAQTREAGRASADFSVILESLKGGLRGLETANPTAPMVQGFNDLSKSALDAANAAGQADAAYGGVGAGAETAARKVGESRQAFIDAAMAAGVGEVRANALADSMGLIPAAVKTQFLTNADPVTAQLITLKSQFDAVPGTKSVIVNMLTEDAQQRLKDLGFSITDLGNNQFEVGMKDDKARANLDNLVGAIEGTTATFQLNADPAKANGETTAAVAFADGSTGTLTLDGNGQPCLLEVNGLKYKIDTTTGELTILGNPKPGEASRDGLKLSIDRTTGKMILAADDTSGRGTANNFYNSQNGRVITYTVKVAVQAVNIGAALGLRGAGGMLVGKPTMAMRQGRGFSGGGFIIDGYSPGQDTVGPLWLSPGEAVLVPELVRQIGPSNILRANKLASGGRRATIAGDWPGFAGGGVVSTSTTARTYLTSTVPTAGFTGPGGVPASVVVSPPRVDVNVFIDGDEFRGLVRTEISTQERETVRRARAGSGATF